MKKYRVSDTLTEGDIVEYGVDSILFKAVIMDESLPCTSQCAMAGIKDHAFCAGFCYRWENGENFVFKEAEVDGKKNVTVTETSRTRQSKEETL